MTLAAFIEMIYICIHHGTISLQVNKQRTFFIQNYKTDIWYICILQNKRLCNPLRKRIKVLYCQLRRSRISNMERIIPIPFLAIKIDSSFLYSNTITRRTIKNTRSITISKMFRSIAVRFLGFSSFRLFSAICQGESSKLRQAKAIIPSPNSFGMP